MRVVVNNECKQVQVWCTQDERDSEGFWDGLQRMEGYKTVLYISCTQPLEDPTAALLRQ